MFQLREILGATPRDQGEAAGRFLIEFTQAYDDGSRIFKRGLDATPMVVRKYDIGPDEAMTFSNHRFGSRAMTAFHFHPDFPDEDRRSFMEAHEEGHDVAMAAAAQSSAERKALARRWRDRLAGGTHRLGVTFQAMVVYVATHGPLAR